MAYPAGFSSDEEDFNGFLTDESCDDAVERNANREVNNEPQELTQDQILDHLFYAIMNGDLEKVQSIFNDGVDVDVRLKDNWTPLMLAANVGNPEITRELINKNANVNADKAKYTVLMAACNCPTTTSPYCLDVVTQLLEKGALVDVKAGNRKTALMFAASSGNVAVIKKVLEASRDINAEDNQGWNALFWAVSDNKLEAVDLLLNEGLNANKVDVRGNRPLDHAISQGYEDIIDILSVQNEETIGLPNSCYDLETFLSDSQRPKFYKDIHTILYGVKCEHLLKKFDSIDLLNFLNITTGNLLEIGVRLPYEQNKILQGLFKFHKRPYRRKSLNAVAKDSLCSTVEVANNLVSIIRQLTIMEASMEYVRRNIKEDPAYLLPIIKILNTKIRKLKWAASNLTTLSKKWDSNVYDADLISNKDSKWKWWKLSFWPGLIVISATIIFMNKGSTL